MKRAFAVLGRKRGSMLLLAILAGVAAAALKYVLDGWTLSPFTLYAGLAGAGAMLVISGICILVADAADDSVNSPEKLEAAANAPVLALIPHCTRAGTRDDATVYHLAESYNTLRNNVAYVTGDARVIAVTAATMGDGKTTVAINLAKSLMTGDRTVAVIDADMRNPSVHRRLRLNNASGGLSAALELGEEAVLTRLRGMRNLYVLRAGARPDDPSFLLRSAAMADLLKKLRERFDYVIIDAPPVLPVPDCAALAQNADALLLVARYGETATTAAHRAAGAIKIANSSFSGAVLNDIPAPVCRSYGRPYVKNV